MAAFPSGTRTFFKHTTSPTGWTKDSNSYNHTLRIITTSTFGSGGTVDFTDFFTSTRTAGSVTYPASASTVTVNSAQMDIPAHTHPFSGSVGTPINSPNSGYPYTAGPTSPSTITGWFGAPSTGQSGSAGVGTGHTHTLSGTLKVDFSSSSSADFSVKYVDSIICIKD